MKADPKPHRTIVRMNYRLPGFLRSGDNETILVMPREEECKSVAAPESAGKLLQDRSTRRHDHV